MMYEDEIKSQRKRLIQSLSGKISQDIEKVKLINLLSALLPPNERSIHIQVLESHVKDYEDSQHFYSAKVEFLTNQDEFKK